MDTAPTYADVAIGAPFRLVGVPLTFFKVTERIATGGGLYGQHHYIHASTLVERAFLHTITPLPFLKKDRT